MEFTAEQIAGIIQGTVEGDGAVVVYDLAKIEEGKPGCLSFLANPKYEEFLYSTKSSICIVNQDFVPSKPLPVGLTLIRVSDAYACFARLLEFYAQLTAKSPGIEQPSFIAESAVLENDVYVGAFAYIGEKVQIGKGTAIYPHVHLGDGVVIGEGTVVHPNVTIYHGCRIGSHCIIHAGAVIGSDGFGFAPDADGVFKKVPQIGNVVIEDHAEIGANTTIDRATMGSTYIRKGVKIDNLVQIAHNVDVGTHTAIAAQVGVAGSAKIGNRVMIGGQAGISGHLHVADDTKIVAQSGVPATVKKADTLMGSPAIPIDEFKRSYFGFRKLPFILKKLQELEQKINEKSNE
jgi:UDP-3-O-[3-hydroxymyristoyl] glucosamine N-acyltransferase